MGVLRERIGTIFVHGIGDHRRFEHVDAAIRPLIDAVRLRTPAPDATVEIVGSGAATLRAEQDTWTGQPGAPLRAIVRQPNGKQQELLFHEVWWADVNEPYTLKKEIKFWLWGLSIWSLPNKLNNTLSGSSVMQMPRFPGGLSKLQMGIARLQLFAVSNVFLVGAYSIGVLVFLARRLLGLHPPDLVRVFVNYVSAVKLYNQTKRSDGGFIDAYREPPRVSIRRRMIRTIVDVALQNYDRWYVVAHSLGSVVAYNGMMENGRALANYLDEPRWQDLVAKGLAGRRRPHDPPPAPGDMLPRRPVWLADDDMVYRDELFKGFRGLLTYGSPLDKFATLWPARVPINVGEAAFTSATEWINIYDPTDPVGASLDAFDTVTLASRPVIQPRNLAYKAHWLLLYSHLCYLRIARHRLKAKAKGTSPGPRNQLSDALVDWLLDGGSFTPAGGAKSPWIVPQSRTQKLRRVWAYVMWIVIYLVLLVLAVVTIPMIMEIIGAAWSQLLTFLKRLFGSYK
jgi:hypothetical protein